MDYGDARTVLILMQRVGIAFDAMDPAQQTANPGHHLDLDDALHLIEEGPAKFWPFFFGVTPLQYHRWATWQETQGGCCGRTQKGTECKGSAQVHPGANSPRTFVAGMHDRCHYHQNQDPARQHLVEAQDGES